MAFQGEPFTGAQLRRAPLVSTVPAGAQGVLGRSAHPLLETRRWGRFPSPRDCPFLTEHCATKFSEFPEPQKPQVSQPVSGVRPERREQRAPSASARFPLLNNNNNYYNYNNNKKSCSLQSRDRKDLVQGDPGLRASSPPPCTSGGIPSRPAAEGTRPRGTALPESPLPPSWGHPWQPAAAAAHRGFRGESETDTEVLAPDTAASLQELAVRPPERLRS